MLAALATVLIELLPLLDTPPSALAELAVLSLAGLTLAVATRSAPPTLAMVAGPAGLLPSRDVDGPVVRGPAVDPTHHPLAPRAPGLA